VTHPLLRQIVERGGRTGQISERRTTERVGARGRPGSGAQLHSKGDGDLDVVLVECKSTRRGSFRLDLGDLIKISREAADEGKHPALTLTYVDEQGRPKRYGSWVLVPERVLGDVLEVLRGEK